MSSTVDVDTVMRKERSVKFISFELANFVALPSGGTRSIDWEHEWSFLPMPGLEEFDQNVRSPLTFQLGVGTHERLALASLGYEYTMVDHMAGDPSTS